IWVVLVIILPRGVAVGINALLPGTTAVRRQLELDAAISRLKIEQAQSQQDAYAAFLQRGTTDRDAQTELRNRVKEAAGTLDQKRRALLDASLDQQDREESLRDQYLHGLALLTPAALFNEGAADLSWTGRLQRQKFYRDARLYDDEIGRRLVESRHTMYGAGDPAGDAGSLMVMVDNVRPFLVQFQTNWVPVGAVLAPSAVAIAVLLCMAAAAFFAAQAFFTRADVRP
ncbi:MAG: hypothetical protein JOZ54_25320, partial [Acidobacteria bacterium]|nr:hypothetical protein [Acidobacteriota bacterium]